MLRKTLIALLLVAPFVASASAQEDSWPAWRGDGTGVSSDSRIPTDWEADGKVLWETRIPGSGHASPIVRDGRVIVSSTGGASIAREREEQLGTALLILAAVALLGVLVALAGLAREPKDAAASLIRGRPWIRAIAALERIAAIGLTAYLFYQLRAFYTGVAPGLTADAPHLTWIYSGEALVFGAIAVAGACWAGTNLRLLAILALALAGLGFNYYQPRQTANVGVPLDWQFNVLKPLAAAVAWFVVAEILARVGRFRAAPRRLAALWPVATLAAIILTFGFYNYMVPQLGARRLVMTLDADTGEVLWQHRVDAPTGRKYPSNSYATPTPATDGDVIIADFGPVMVALDWDGELLWEREEPGFMEHLRHGAAVSPVIHDGALIHAYYPEISAAGEEVSDWSHEKFSYLAKLDLETGEEIWRVDEVPGGHDAFATPLIMETADGPAIVILVMDHAHGYAADTGEHLWSFEHPVAVPVPSPVADTDTVYIGGGLYGPAVLAAIELGEGAVSLSGTPEARWSTTRSTPEVSSLLLVDDLLYWVTQNGRMFCADVTDGSIVWRARLNGGVNASPVYADGKIIVPGSDGDVYMVAPGRTFELLATNPLGRAVFASPAVSGGRIYLRTGRSLIAIAAK